MLITYPDSLGGNLETLNEILEKHFQGVIGGIHILPFYPASGDRGFAVINYDEVSPEFGTWADIKRLSDKYYLMADFMINHMSIRSEEFRDYMRLGDASEYKDLFLDWNKFWPEGEPTAEEAELLPRRKLRRPCFEFTRDDGKTVVLWNTFFEEQVDIDPWTDAAKAYYSRNLGRLSEYMPLIRLDALAYATKKPGTNCFFVEPEIWELLELSKNCTKPGTELLPEIHSDYRHQLRMAEKGYWVYDFALPMLLLHAIFSGRADRLLHWFSICPRKQFTTLDTHDGIGVVDVAGLLSDEEIDFVRDIVNSRVEQFRPYFRAPIAKVKVNNAEARQYQLMCTYYSALGEDDKAWLLARCVQLFAPGIPMVYYVGLLAGENDGEAVKQDGEPRSLNRHNFTFEEVEERLNRPVLKRLYEVMRFRNRYAAFEGEFSACGGDKKSELILSWKKEDTAATLRCDLATQDMTIEYFEDGELKFL